MPHAQDPDKNPNPAPDGESGPSPAGFTSEHPGSLQGDPQNTGAWTKVCPKCSVQAAVPGGFCPNCGASYDKSARRFKPSRKALVISLVALLVVGGTTGTVLAVQHSQAVAAEEEAERRAKTAAKAAADRKAREAEEAAARDDAERAIRTLIVTGLEDSVQKDAVERVTEGRLDGPIERTECTPLGGGSIDDLTAITGTFECIAVNQKNEDGTESGYVFSATVNWDEGSYSWRLGR